MEKHSDDVGYMNDQMSDFLILTLNVFFFRLSLLLSGDVVDSILQYRVNWYRHSMSRALGNQDPGFVESPGRGDGTEAQGPGDRRAEHCSSVRGFGCNSHTSLNTVLEGHIHNISTPYHSAPPRSGPGSPFNRR